MSQTRPDYLSYLLRMRRADNAGWPNWWASLESMTTGEHHSFADLDGLFVFLRTRAGGSASDAAAQTAVALIESLRAGNPQASHHLARLLQADWNGALRPLTAGVAQRLGLSQEEVHEALIGATQDCCPSQDGVANVPTGDPSNLVNVTKLQQAEEALRRHNRELAVFNRAAQALTSSLELNQVLAMLLEEARYLLDVTACSVWLVDPGTGELVCQQAAGPGSEVLHGRRLAPGEGGADWAARGESLIAPNVRTDERHFKSLDQQIGLPVRSTLIVPLRVRGNTIGMLEAADMEASCFDDTDLALLESLAAAAAIAIDNAGLIEALRRHTLELQEQNEELDAFAHTVAHDLKSPLGAVIGFAEVLVDDRTKLPDEKVQEILESLASTGKKMDSIIETLLLMSSVRQMNVGQGPLDTASIVSEALRRVAPMIEEYQGEIILPEAWPVALGYGPWVEEVWANYLSNAIKHGGRPPRVELGATQVDGAVRFWVSDNGPGVPPEAQAGLFVPFTRLGQVSAEGHGLGLSIVRRIVEKLGGQVGIESQVSQGSIFFFTLPGAEEVP